MKLSYFKSPLILVSALVALTLHLLSYDRIPLQFDELLMYDLVAKLDYFRLIKFLIKTEIQMPLVYLLIKFLGELSGYSSFVLRLPSLLAALVLPFVFYPLACLSLKREDALKSVILLMLFFPVLLFSGSMRPYILILTLTIIVLYYFRLFLLGNPVCLRGRICASSAAILLALIHPVGTLTSCVFFGIFCFKHRKKYPKSVFTFFVVLAALSLTYLLLRLEHWGYILGQIQGLREYFDYIYKFSFLTSGREFSLLLVVLAGLSIFKSRLKFISSKRFELSLIIVPLAIGSLLGIFGKTHIFARHFMIILPFLAIITLQMINEATDSEARRNILFGLAALLLIYKFTFKEQAWQIPFEINSAGISEEAIKLSENKRPIINCGNCLSYYIKSKKLECMGSLLKHDRFADWQEFVFVDLDYVQENCSLNNIDKKNYEVLDSRIFKGGKVYLIAPQDWILNPK